METDLTLQDELQKMQARAQYADSRAAVAEAELQSLKKVCLVTPIIRARVHFHPCMSLAALQP